MLVGFTLARSPLLLSLSMATSEARNPQTYLRASAAVIWDVDGTPMESTTLGFTATNEVLSTSGYRMVTEEYKLGCRFTTPDRFIYHIERPAGSADLLRLPRYGNGRPRGGNETTQGAQA